MPCYTVQTVSVEFTMKHKDRVFDAARQLGLNVRHRAGSNLAFVGEVQIDFFRQKAHYDESDTTAAEQVNLLRKQYSINAIKDAATKAGWNKAQVARLSANRKINKLTITRR